MKKQILLIVVTTLMSAMSLAWDDSYNRYQRLYAEARDAAEPTSVKLPAFISRHDKPSAKTLKVAEEKLSLVISEAWKQREAARAQRDALNKERYAAERVVEERRNTSIMNNLRRNGEARMFSSLKGIAAIGAVAAAVGHTSDASAQSVVLEKSGSSDLIGADTNPVRQALEKSRTASSANSR